MKHKSETYNPEIERQLDAIATLCGEKIDSDSEGLAADQFVQRSTRLLKGLLLSGFTRTATTPLKVELEQRVVERFRKAAMHRRAAVTGIAGRMQEKFEELARWESTKPAEDDAPHAANPSSAAMSTRRRPRSANERD